MTDEPLTARQWQAQVLETRNRILRERRRIWPEGELRTCPVCGKANLRGRSDLWKEVDVTGAVLVFANLHGAHCEACGTEFLEPYEQIAIEDRAGSAFRAPISGSVSALGGKKLGTYWPRDVQRALRLHAKDDLEITPLAPDTVVIRVVHRLDDTEQPVAGA